MTVEIPFGLVPFAREFSKYKTPATRTQGWAELPHETRGEGDFLDTIGTLMLWRYFVASGTPATYQLTAGQGDEADILISPPYQDPITINVKTSKWSPSGDADVCKAGHIAIKEVEEKKGLSEIYFQVFVHLENPRHIPDHVHICGYIGRDEIVKCDKTSIPNTGGTIGYWIPCRELGNVASFQKWVRDIWENKPEEDADQPR